MNTLSPGITKAGGWGLETIITLTLVFTVFCATDAERGSETAHLPVSMRSYIASGMERITSRPCMLHACSSGVAICPVQVLAPFAIGMDVFLCHLVAIPLDGCSINPARSFGASLVAGQWTDQWVFGWGHSQALSWRPQYTR